MDRFLRLDPHATFDMLDSKRRCEMNIVTQAQDFELSEAIDQFARQQIEAALERFREDVLAVDVFMKDCNGPKGGVDKQALIRVRLRNGPVVALETDNENLYAAIKTGARRLKRTVRRQLRKARRIEKQRIRDHFAVTGVEELASRS